MMTWFTSDLHLGHANVISFSHRPWDSVDAMDAALIDGINERVSPTDELWVLGDWSYRIDKERAARLRRRVACRNVHLVPGNHDKDWSQPDALAGTFEVEPPLCTYRTEWNRIVLCHYPIEDWQGRSHGTIHLHGHIHSVGPDYNELNRMQGILRYDVGVDANGYRPVSLDEILGWFDGVRSSGYADWRRWVVSTDNPEAEEYASMLLLDMDEGA